MSSNVFELPRSFEQRLQSALDSRAGGNCSKALDEVLGLIDDGCEQALVYARLIYELGCRDVDQDFQKARFYYELAIERRGNAEAYLGLGRLYYFGAGVDRDPCKAFEYFDLVAREAAKGGIAYLMLGHSYARGECVDKNLEEARRCYTKAWQNGYVLGLTNLGKVEQEMGHPLKGWAYRLKAAFVGMDIMFRKPEENWRLRPY